MFTEYCCTRTKASLVVWGPPSTPTLSLPKKGPGLLRNWARAGHATSSHPTRYSRHLLHQRQPQRPPRSPRVGETQAAAPSCTTCDNVVGHRRRRRVASLPSDRQALSSPLERSPCSGPRAGGSPAASLPLLLHCFCFFSSSFLLLLLLLLLLLQVILLPRTPTQNTCKEICMLLCSQQNTQDDSKRGATWRLVREPPAPCPLSPVPVPVPCSWLRPRSLAASASAQPCQHHVAAPPFCACHRARRPDAQRMKDTAPNWRGLPSLLPTNSTTDLPIVAAHGLPPSLPPPASPCRPLSSMQRRRAAAAAGPHMPIPVRLVPVRRPTASLLQPSPTL